MPRIRSPLDFRTGADVRAWRLAHGYTIRGWAEAMGVSRSTVQRWEADNPPPDRTARLAMIGLETVETT